MSDGGRVSGRGVKLGGVEPAGTNISVRAAADRLLSTRERGRVESRVSSLE